MNYHSNQSFQKPIYIIYIIYNAFLTQIDHFLLPFFVEKVDKVEVKNRLVDNVGRIGCRMHFFLRAFYLGSTRFLTQSPSKNSLLWFTCSLKKMTSTFEFWSPF
jgi:hypothetical protein